MGSRRRAVVAVLAMAVAVALPVALACNSTGVLMLEHDDAAVAGDAGLADADADAAEAAAPVAYWRLANWSPGSPALDVCFAPSGAGWSGVQPAIGQPAADADAGPGGAPFPQATRYFAMAPGAYSMRVVAAGAADCSTGLVELAALMLPAGVHATLAVLGAPSPDAGTLPLRIALFADDVAAPDGQIGLRFINASASASDGTVDVGTGSVSGAGGAFTTLFAAVEFGTASSASSTDAGLVDANGYLFTLPFATATVSARVTTMAANDLVVALDDVSVLAGSAATLALVGTAAQPELVQCPDVRSDDAEGAGLWAGCAVISQ